MKAARVIYHLARADFLERVRRYSFLLTLGFAGLLASGVYRGQIVLTLGHYYGAPNSAWFGAFLAMVATTFLSIVGFYIVRNTIQHDQQTRVGQILAATPITNSAYAAGKTLSNFAVLASMVLILALGAAVLQLARGHGAIDLWQLLSPFVLVALPAMAVVAALAVLSETIPGLRGGLGNVLYFFFWNGLLVTAFTIPAFDFAGLSLYMQSMGDTLRKVDPSYVNSFTLQIGPDKVATRQFEWQGLHWNATMIGERLLWLGVAVILAWLAARLFDRFDPAKESARLRKTKLKAAPPDEAGVVRAAGPRTVVHLTSPASTGRGNFSELIRAELRLMLAGTSRWWYLVALVLWVASLATPLDVSRGLLAAVWIWPLLLWSKMGVREGYYATSALVFSSPSPLHRQLPALWLSGVIVALAAGSGVALRLVIASDLHGLATWLAGALFIPTFALALGVFSGTSKVFEALYTVWWYVGPGNHVPYIDFMGTVASSGRPGFYFVLTAALLLAAYAGRRARLAYA
ncbi:MAG TPA: hypothetical protein VIX19_04900 [Terriglobales bacterium]